LQEQSKSSTSQGKKERSKRVNYVKILSWVSARNLRPQEWGERTQREMPKSQRTFSLLGTKPPQYSQNTKNGEKLPKNPETQLQSKKSVNSRKTTKEK